MSMNKPEIKFSDKEDKATIVYQTNEGSVMVEFYQKPKNPWTFPKAADRPITRLKTLQKQVI